MDYGYAFCDLFHYFDINQYTDICHGYFANGIILLYGSSKRENDTESYCLVYLILINLLLSEILRQYSSTVETIGVCE